MSGVGMFQATGIRGDFVPLQPVTVEVSTPPQRSGKRLCESESAGRLAAKSDLRGSLWSREVFQRGCLPVCPGPEGQHNLQH